MQPNADSNQSPISNIRSSEDLYTFLTDNYRAQAAHAHTTDTAGKQRAESLRTAGANREKAAQTDQKHHEETDQTANQRLEMRKTAATETLQAVHDMVDGTNWPEVSDVESPPVPTTFTGSLSKALDSLRSRALDLQWQLEHTRTDLLALRRERAARRDLLASGGAILIALILVRGWAVLNGIQAAANANAAATQVSLTTATQVAHLKTTATRASLNTATAVAYLNITATQALLGTSTMIAYQNAVLSGQTIIRNFAAVPMVLVPPGCFMMGSDPTKDPQAQSDEEPQTKICFAQPFWLDETPVTQAQFKLFGGEAAHASYFSGDNRPVESITWFEATDFCAKRGTRLPTEAEYEYAARGPDDLIDAWGNNFDANEVVYDGNSGGQRAEVGSKPLGKSWVGALDMSGNVWEWTSSIYKPYPYNATDGRDNNGDTNSARVLRGGSWFNSYSFYSRAADRHWYLPSFEINYNGFRCARS